MQKKGQALVEFVIILPIFIFLLFAIIDIGKILFLKNELEEHMNFVVEEYKNQKTVDEILSTLKESDSKLVLESDQTEQKFITFTLKEETDIITPGLNLIFKTPYYVSVKRVVSHEL